MRIRDALESDAEALAMLSGKPEGVVINMIHDRSVRVAVPESEHRSEKTESDQRRHENESDQRRHENESDQRRHENESNRAKDAKTGSNTEHPSGAGNPSPLQGFIGYDVRSGSVHVTDFGGSESTVRRLFEEPRRFAVREGMSLEVVVSDDATDEIETIESLGFEPVGEGPQFDGGSTTRFRLEPSGTD